MTDRSNDIVTEIGDSTFFDHPHKIRDKAILDEQFAAQMPEAAALREHDHRARLADLRVRSGGAADFDMELASEGLVDPSDEPIDEPVIEAGKLTLSRRLITQFWLLRLWWRRTRS